MTQPKVYIVIYSLYHHIYKLSRSIRDGLEAKGVNVQTFQVKETLQDYVLEKMHAPAKPNIPIIEPHQLAEADGIIFGIPTRFGIFPAQMKALLDATGKLWANGSLSGKFVATFFATASQHGGQETTALNAVTYFAHHGMIYVPFGYANANMSNNDVVVGGSAYGAGTITNGDGSRQPSELELAIANDQGENFATVLNTFTRGADTDASTRSIRGETPLGEGTPTGKGSESLNPEPAAAPAMTTEHAMADVTSSAAGGAVGANPGAAASVEPGIEAVATPPTPATGPPAVANTDGPALPLNTTTETPVPVSETTGAKNATTAAAAVPKKKKRFWFCCGNPDQVD
ncbi:hypothetical protein DFQ28_000370 [Apophysomyces sp. BC1034]|nr:hypothetical protein DFQ30_004271 [Apophysomyces sp. BC1015]KAG0177159.1 hypothetical protein DFQ29_005177 [Apophysomyces sp. BC1021]KAG0191357.1 hypothetical protein DFQ28_000370 [Apophysomyces sp. BC1034]